MEFLNYMMEHKYIINIISFVLNIFHNFGDSIVYYVILFKIFLQDKYIYIKKKLVVNNYITGCYLINDDNIIENKNIEYIGHIDINKEIFEDMFKINKLEITNNCCILIKYIYEGCKNRCYVNYNSLDEKIQYFPLNIEKMKECNIAKYSSDKLFFFNNECNEIDIATINGINIKEMMKECNGSFNDFGILNNNKVYVKYIMKELSIDNLEELNIKYTNFHLNEEKMELEDHIIKITNEDEYITSSIINKIIN